MSSPAASAFSISPGLLMSNMIERVQVAVAGMEDVRDPEAVAVADLADALEHIGSCPVGMVPSMQM